MQGTKVQCNGVLYKCSYANGFIGQEDWSWEIPMVRSIIQIVWYRAKAQVGFV